VNKIWAQLVTTMGIVGTLAVAIVFYIKHGREAGIAESAAIMATDIARANKLYAMEHNGTYTNGKMVNKCNTQSCPSFDGPLDPCNLVACRYLTQSQWEDTPYIAAAGDPTKSEPCPSGSLSCVIRKTPKNCPFCNGATEEEPYTGWGYAVGPNGSPTPQGEAPEVSLH
jgi:hypothetical protein